MIALEGLTLRAIAFKVIVEPETEPERPIHVVKDMADAFRVGRVLSIGKEAADKLPDLRVGDRVLYAQTTSCTTAVKGRHIVHHDHVLCVVEGEGPIDARASAIEQKTAQVSTYGAGAWTSGRDA